MLLIPLAFVSFVSFGSRDDPEAIVITGRVRLVGTALFSDLVVTDEEYDWYLENEDRQKLANMEQRRVTVQGRPEYEELFFASGRSAGTKRYLRDIKLIRVE